MLNPHEVAELLGLHVQVVRQKLRRGEIPGRRIGRWLRVPEDELEKWIRGLPASNT